MIPHIHAHKHRLFVRREEEEKWVVRGSKKLKKFCDTQKIHHQ